MHVSTRAEVNKCPALVPQMRWTDEIGSRSTGWRGAKHDCSSSKRVREKKRKKYDFSTMEKRGEEWSDGGWKWGGVHLRLAHERSFGFASAFPGCAHANDGVTEPRPPCASIHHREYEFLLFVGLSLVHARLHQRERQRRCTRGDARRLWDASSSRGVKSFVLFGDPREIHRAESRRGALLRVRQIARPRRGKSV